MFDVQATAGKNYVFGKSFFRVLAF